VVNSPTPPFEEANETIIEVQKRDEREERQQPQIRKSTRANTDQRLVPMMEGGSAPNCFGADGPDL
jgi:hypothetical protein